MPFTLWLCRTGLCMVAVGCTLLREHVAEVFCCCCTLLLFYPLRLQASLLLLLTTLLPVRVAAVPAVAGSVAHAHVAAAERHCCGPARCCLRCLLRSCGLLSPFSPLCSCWPVEFFLPAAFLRPVESFQPVVFLQPAAFLQRAGFSQLVASLPPVQRSFSRSIPMVNRFAVLACCAIRAVFTRLIAVTEGRP